MSVARQQLVMSRFGAEFAMAHAKSLPPLISPDDYLVAEMAAEDKCEFVHGVVFAMAGASEGHNEIVQNLAFWLRSHVPEGCRVFSTDMKLRTHPSHDTSFYYPDVFVSCGPRDPKSHVRSDAALVIEVLSPSTERADRREKFLDYVGMPSLADYVLVSQDGTCVEVFRRSHAWSREIYRDLTDMIVLDSIPTPLPMTIVYTDIQF